MGCGSISRTSGFLALFVGALLNGAPPTPAQDLASGELLIFGANLEVGPAFQEIDPGRPTVVHTSLGDLTPGHAPTGLRAKGELTGPGLGTPLSLSTVPGEPFRIPGLHREGTYTLSAIRLMDGETVLGSAVPSSVEILVHRLVVTSVTSRLLTPDEMARYGIVVDEDSYSVWRYTVGFQLEGGAYEIPFDMLQGPDGLVPLQLPDPYDLPLPPGEGLPGVPVPQVNPGHFRLKEPGGDLEAPPSDLGAGLSIPGFIIIPSDISFLHQFFSVIAVVQNGALEGSGLELRDLHGNLELTGDGLRQAETEPPTIPGEPVSILDPGPDGEPGTGDDLTIIVARAQGQATWLVEGLSEGQHILNVHLEGELHGLASGEPAGVEADIPGVVVVRDPRFAMTFLHPWTVRAGESYPFRVVLTNTSITPVNDLTLTLPPTSLSGARLDDPDGPDRSIASLAPGETVTVSWQLESLTTGRVVASAFNSSGPIDASFRFSVGVGELGIPLSPESLVLPPEIEVFGDTVTTPAVELLGLAYCLATAPDGTEIELPPVGEAIVRRRGQELAAAGRRVAWGEPLNRATAAFATAWLGSTHFSSGFDALRRASTRGHQIEGILTGALSSRSAEIGADPALAELEELLITGRPSLLVIARGAGFDGSARLAVSGLASGLVAMGRSGDVDVFTRDLAGAAVLDSTGLDSEIALVTVPVDDEGLWLESGYQVQLHGTAAGSVELEVIIILPDGSTRRILPSAVTTAPSSLAFVAVGPSADELTLYADTDGDLVQDVWEQVPVTTQEPPEPRVLAVHFSDLLQAPANGPYRDLLLLSSQPVDGGTLAAVDPASWRAGSVLELPSPTGTFVRERRGAILTPPSDPRLLVLTTDAPLNPHATLHLSSGPEGLPYPGGRRLDLIDHPVQISDGLDTGVVRGVVIGGDGSPVPDASVELYERVAAGRKWILSLSDRVHADADGAFVLDAVRVRQHSIPARHASFTLRATDPLSGHQGLLTARLPADGAVLDLLLPMVGRGDVIGTVLRADGEPAIGAVVHARSITNPSEGATASPDAVGGFRLTDLPVGPVQILATEDARYTFATVMIPAPGHTAAVELILPEATVAARADVTGSVIDGATAAPGSGLQVFVSPAGADGPTHSATTDTDGGFDVGGVPPGIATFTVWDPARSRYVAEHLTELFADATNRVEIVTADESSATVLGTVSLDLAGTRTPVAGAYVIASSLGAWTLTDADGSYSLTDLPLGATDLQARDPVSGASASRSINLTADGQVQTVDLVLSQSTGSIGVAVVDRWGQPLAGARVALGSFFSSFTCLTDDVGTCQIDDVGPGTHTALADYNSKYGQDHATVLYDGDHGETTVTVGDRIDFDVITVVETEGGGTAQVLSQIDFKSYGKSPQSGRLGFIPVDDFYTCGEGPGGCGIDDTGRASFGGVHTGSFAAWVRNGFSGLTLFNRQLLPEDDGRTFVINLSAPGRVTGRVVEAVGDDLVPVADTMLEMWVVVEGSGLVRQAIATTPADGAFEFDLVPPGAFSVRAYHPPSGTLQWINGSIGTAQVIEDLELVLRPVGGVEGEVAVCFGGVPDPGAEAHLELRPHGVPQPFFAELTIPELSPRELDVPFADQAMASFVFTGLSTVNWHLEASSATHGAAWQGLTITPGLQTLSEPVCLHPTGTISGTVIDPGSGAGVPSATVQLSGGTAGTFVTDASDQQGLFAFSEVPVGTYRIRVYDAASNRGAVSDQVQLCAEDHPGFGSSCGLELEQDVVLTGLKQITGTLQQADGTGVANAPLRVRTAVVTNTDGTVASSQAEWLAFTDAAGLFELDGIPAGTARLEAFDPLSPLWTETTVEVDPAANGPIPVDLVLPPTADVAVRVLDPFGAPHAGDDPVVAFFQWSPRFKEPYGGTPAVSHVDHGAVVSFSGAVAGSLETAACSGGCDGLGFDELRRHHYLEALGASASPRMSDPPEDLIVDLQLVGRADVVLAVGLDGAPVHDAEVTLTGGGFYGQVQLVLHTGADGLTAPITGLGVGRYSAFATHDDGSGNTLRGVSEVVIEQGHHDTTLTIPVALESATAVSGRAVLPDGSAAAEALVTLILDGSGRVFQVLAAADGSFTFPAIPSGHTYFFEAAVPPARHTLRGLPIDGDAIDLGTLQLDAVDPTVHSISPANGAQEIDTTSVVTIELSELMRHASLTDRVTLRPEGGQPLSLQPTVTDIPDGRTAVSLVPGVLASNTLYVLTIGTDVEDLAGRVLRADVHSTFRTRDTVPPEVIGSDPIHDPDGLTPVGPDVEPLLHLSETVDPVSVDAASVRLVAPGGVVVTCQLVLERDGFDIRLRPDTGLQPDSYYTIEADGVTDTSGNPLASPFTATFRVRDTEPPQVTLDLPAGATADGDTWLAREGTWIELRAAVTSNDAVHEAWFTVNGAVHGPAELVGDAYRLPLQVPSAPGELVLAAAAQDVSGNTGTSPTHPLVIVDDAPPTAQMTVTPSASILPNHALEVVVEASDDQGLDAVVITLSGAVQDTRTYRPASTFFTANLVHRLPFSASGHVVVDAHVVDSIGQSTPLAQQSVIVLADSTAPSVTAVRPVHGSVHASGTSLDPHFDLEDNVAVETVALEIDGQPWPAQLLTLSLPGNSWTGRADAVWTAPEVDSDTDVTLVLTATDPAGHATTETVTITVQPLDHPDAPQVDILCPANGDLVVADIPVTVAFEITDDVEILDYTVLVDSVPVGDPVPVNASHHSGSIEWTPPATAQPGDSFRITVQARDALYTGSGRVTLAATTGTILVGDQDLDATSNGADLVLAGGVFTATEALDLASLVLVPGTELRGTPLDLAVGGNVHVGACAVLSADRVDLDVLHTLTVAAGGQLDTSGRGYPGGTWDHPDGHAPDGVLPARPEAGGSHGGVGDAINVTSAGEVYGSLFAPTLPGAGGASVFGGDGGGVITIVAGTLVLDGEILARGPDLDRDSGGGAGGAIQVHATTVLGAGFIDASGGSSHLDGYADPDGRGGGGGRIALVAEVLEGFDPATQLIADGGAALAPDGSPVRLAGLGTVLVHGPGATHGALRVGSGDCAALPTAATPLPGIGSGLVGVTETAGDDLWIEPADPERRFDLGVTGLWVRALGNDFRVLAEDARRRLLLEGAAGAVQPGDAYEGLIKLDRAEVGACATLAWGDTAEVGELVVGTDAAAVDANGGPPAIDFTRVHLGAAQGDFHIQADPGAVLDPDGIVWLVLHDTPSGARIELTFEADGSVPLTRFDTGFAGGDAVELEAWDAHAAPQSTRVTVGTLPVNLAPIVDAGAIAFVADPDGTYRLAGAAGAVSDDEPPVLATLTNQATALSSWAEVAPDGSFNMLADGSHQDPFVLDVADSHPEPLTTTLDLGPRPDVLPPVIDPDQVSLYAHSRTFHARGAIGAVIDDTSITSATLHAGSHASVGLVVAADGSFPEVIVAAPTGTACDLTADDIGGNQSSIVVGSLPVNSDPPAIDPSALARLTGDGVYTLRDDSWWEFDLDLGFYGDMALVSWDGIELAWYENRTTPGHGPWPVATNDIVIYHELDTTTVTGAIGDEIWLVAEDGHPDWQWAEALVWTLPQIPGAPQIDTAALGLGYWDGYRLTGPAGAVTGDPEPLQLTVRVWRDWSEVSSVSIPAYTSDQVLEVQIDGEPGDLVVLTATDGAGRTTEVRVGTLPETLTARFSSARFWVLETGSQVEVTVRLSEENEEQHTVVLATADASATSGSDYVALSETLTFDPYDLTATATITILDDALTEGDETLDLLLEQPSARLQLGDGSTAEVVIADTEGPPRTVRYSVGVDSGNMLVDGDIDVSIADGVMTFADPLPPGPDRGDRVHLFESGVSLFIDSCLDDTHCRVVTREGLPPNDLASEAEEWTDGIYPAFSSLSAAVAGAGDPSHLGTFDLTAANAALELLCYGGSADIDPVSVSGWTTSPQHRLRLVAPTAAEQRGGSQRHMGRWSDTAYRLEIVDPYACLRLDSGNVDVEGLQLYCTGETGVMLGSGTVDGTVSISESIIRLDRSPDQRTGIWAYVTGGLELSVRNCLLYDLGDGSGTWQVGIDAGSSTTNLEATGNTIVGGTHGILRWAGTLTATNNLVVDSSVQAYQGTFDPASSHNLSSDESAPGSNPVQEVDVTFTDPVSDDYHLACRITARQPVISHHGLDGENLAWLFDGEIEEAVRSGGTNPIWVQLELAEPVTLDGASVCMTTADNEWMVEVADSVADLEGQTASYRVLVPWRTSPGPDKVWDTVRDLIPATASVIRLNVHRLTGDDWVHLAEWQLHGWNPACASGAHTSVLDIDSVARVGTRDIGADQTRELEVGFVWDTQAWESDGQAVVEVELNEPAPAEVSVTYQTFDGSAVAGLDYQGGSGTVRFEPGQRQQTFTIPVLPDDESDHDEDFHLGLYDAAGARIGKFNTVVHLYDGASPPRAFFATQAMSAGEADGTVQIEIRLDRPPSSTVWVGWTTLDGTAQVGLDYRYGSYGVDFGPGVTSRWVQLALVDDTLDEHDETVRLRLKDPNGCALGTPRSATVTIVDDDEPTGPSSVTVDPARFTLGLSGCIPQLVAGEDAVTAAGSPVLVDVVVDNPDPASDLFLEPLTVTSGAPFSVDLSGGEDILQLGASVVVTASHEGDSATETVAIVPVQPPAIDTGAISIFFEAGWATVEIPFSAVTGRLEQVSIGLHNVATGATVLVLDPCQGEPGSYNGSVEANVGEEVELRLCHGSEPEACTDWISLGDGGGR